MTNKIDISKLEVKSYKKGSYLIVKYYYKMGEIIKRKKEKYQVNANIKIDNETISGLLKKGRSLELYVNDMYT